MGVIQVTISTGKVIRVLMDGLTIIAVAGLGITAMELTSVRQRLKKIEVLDAKLASELEEYFQYADEQKKKDKFLNELNEREEP